MAFVRTLLIIVALLVGWTALRHEGVAGSSTPVQKSAISHFSISQS